MDCNQIFLTRHAIERMFERGISASAIKDIVINGDIIAEYPDDIPFPSYLVLGFENNRPVHIVLARNPKINECYIITAYVPDSLTWGNDFKTKKQS